MCTWVYHFVSWCLTLRSSTRIPEPCNSFNHALCFAAPSLMVFWSHITNVKMSFRICKKILIWRYNTLKHRHTYRKMLNMFQTVCTLYLIYCRLKWLVLHFATWEPIFCKTNILFVHFFSIFLYLYRKSRFTDTFWSTRDKWFCTSKMLEFHLWRPVWNGVF